MAELNIVSADVSNGSTSPRPSVETFSFEGRVEDKLTVEHLQLLMAEFSKPEYQNKGLEMQTFCDVVCRLVGTNNVNVQELGRMFLKVDTSLDGYSDWDELATFLLANYEDGGKDGGSHSEQSVTTTDVHNSPASFKTPIVDLGCQPSSWRKGSRSAERFISVTAQGQLMMYKSNLTPVKDFQAPMLQSTLQVTCCTVLPQMSKLVIALTNRTIRFYDLSSSLTEEACVLTNLADTVMTMAAHYVAGDTCLLMGDIKGNVATLMFPESRFHLLLASSKQGSVDEAEVSLSALHKQDELYRSYALHSDMVDGIVPFTMLGSFISCSSTSTDSVVVCSVSDERRFNIRKGVRSLSYCRHSNLMLTGGIDGTIRMWNPHIVHKPMAVLDGHKDVVVMVAVHCQACMQETCTASLGEIHAVSASADCTIKVWSLTKQACLQTVTDVRSQPITSAHYVVNSGTILIADTRLACVKLRISGAHHSMGSTTHTQPLTGVCHNVLFDELVTASQDSSVAVWSLETGQRLVTYSPAHEGQEITTMRFDASERRLLTGASDGSVKLWNFNVGLSLMKLLPGDTGDVTGIVELSNNNIVTAGWSRTLNLYSQCKGSRYYVPADPGCQGVAHKDDITAMVALPRNNLLASVSADGMLCVWKARDRCTLVRTVWLPKDSVSSSMECLLPLGKRQPDHLIVGGTRGQLWLVDTRAGKILTQTTVCEYTISCMRLTGSRGLTLCDSGGWIRSFDISPWYSSRPCADITPTLCFQAHAQPVVEVQLLPKGFLATASKDCTARVWTQDGRCVGHLGQAEAWNLDDDSTWLWPERPLDLVAMGPVDDAVTNATPAVGNTPAATSTATTVASPSIADLTPLELAAQSRTNLVRTSPSISAVQSAHQPSAEAFANTATRLVRRTTIHRRRLVSHMQTKNRNSTLSKLNTLPCFELDDHPSARELRPNSSRLI